VSATAAVPFVPRLLLDRPADAERHWHSDSTMAFIDISGFTTLSEQLARRGRVGAEDLVSTLTRIFTLLMSATDDGGDVVKFAGDALLVKYDGPDHALHACHAASAIQRLLAVVGNVRLAGARARLRMSVGVHTGRFEFLLTGEEQQNLVVCGPALDRVLELQDAASAGEILVSPEVAAALPAYSCKQAREPGLLLGRVPPVPSLGSSWRPPPGHSHLWRYLPTAFQARHDLLLADSDHRRTAVAFVQVSGLGAALDRRTAAAEIDLLTRAVDDACAETGTTLLDADIARDGYRYFLTAGAPQTVEDPEGRLVRALLRIASVETGGLSVRGGVTAGQVFAGPVGASSRRTFSVMGDTTNLAARLTARAPEGGVLAHDGVLARSLTTFTTEDAHTVRVKGKAEPVPVSVVTGVVGQRGREDTRLPFVGREAELEVLARSLARAADGHGTVVEVVGEAGLGKSRLIAEAVERSGLRIVTLTNDPYGAAVHHRALGLLLRQLLGLSSEDGPEATRARVEDVVSQQAPQLARWLPLLGPALETGFGTTPAVEQLDDRFRPARFRDTVRDLVHALLDEPTVVVVEDAHWVDPMSADTLSAAFSDLEGVPAAVLLSRRDTDAGLHGSQDFATTELRPAPVGADVARVLVGGATQEPLRPAEVEAIVNRASGNPLFLLELAATRSAEEELPSSVEELVGLRMDELDAGDRDTLRQAAVLGSRFPAALHAGVTGAGELVEAAPAPTLLRFLEVTPDGVVVFRREVYREVAYQRLTFRRRREIHARAAQVIEAEPSLAGAPPMPMLSLHFFAAGEWESAYRCSHQAALEARAQYANNEAVEFCTRAIESGRRSGASAAALVELHRLQGEVLNLSGRHAEALRAFAAARRGLSEPSQVVDVVYRIGMVRREAGLFSSALTAAAQVRTLAGSMPAEQQNTWLAEADLLAAGVRYWQGRCPQCQRLSLAAVEHAQTLEEGTTRTRLLARAYSLHDTAVIELEGRPGAYGDLPIRMFGEIGDLYNEGRFCVNLAVGHYYQGDWDLAVAMYRRSLELAERIGDVFSVAVAQMNIGEVLAYQGKPSEARPLLITSLSSLRALKTPLAAAHVACYLGVAARLAGDVQEAGEWFDESSGLFEEAGRSSGFSLDELRTRLLELSLDRGELSHVIEEANGLLARQEPLADVHRARVLRSSGLASLLSDDLDGAAVALQESLRVAADASQPYEQALSMAALAKAEPPDGRELLAEASKILTSLGVVGDAFTG
jgi:class 3 adenylate cyclase/tetratricopeptide (TPR) repeat protein